jgi:hypothetical protein
MSNALATTTLLDGIRAAVLTAWGTMPISYGPPRTPILSTPYAVIQWDTVVVSLDGVGSAIGNPSQRNSFTILGRFPFPTDPTQIIALQKVIYANLLIAQLQSGPEFSSIGILPLVTTIDATEPDDPNERVFEVTLTFEVFTLATYL